MQSKRNLHYPQCLQKSELELAAQAEGSVKKSAETTVETAWNVKKKTLFKWRFWLFHLCNQVW